MRCMIILALLAVSASAFADTETTKTATVTLTIERYVALSQPNDVLLTVPQDEAPGFGTIGGSQILTLWKNTDVDLTVSISGLAPSAALLDKEPTAVGLPGDHVSINGIESAPGETIMTQLQQWVWCTENDGEQVEIDYWWLRNGLCDHAGTYHGTITVTAFGIDP